MTHQEILTTIERLPKKEQFALANSVLDRLAREGSLPVSESLRSEFLRREEAFFANPDQGEPWGQVKVDLFGK